MPKPTIKREKVKDETVLEKAMEICPVNVFEKKDGKVKVAKPEDCIGCKACESVCENDEIEVIED